jgi:hypothetical protein
VLVAQCVVSFLTWIAYGAFEWRRRERVRAKIAVLPRTGRVLGGAAMLLLGAAWLLGGLLAVQSLRGIERGALVPWAWLAVTLIGLGFVYSQTQAVAMMISVVLESDTSHRPESSMMQNTKDLEP